MSTEDLQTKQYKYRDKIQIIYTSMYFVKVNGPSTSPYLILIVDVPPDVLSSWSLRMFSPDRLFRRSLQMVSSKPLEEMVF